MTPINMAIKMVQGAIDANVNHGQNRDRLDFERLTCYLLVKQELEKLLFYEQEYIKDKTFKQKSKWQKVT